MQSYKNCYHCNYEFTLLEERYKMIKQVKPKHQPNRHLMIGFVCIDCIEVKNKKTLIEYNAK